jgi:5,10-methylenetetrahydromethanopterin reductase
VHRSLLGEIGWILTWRRVRPRPRRGAVVPDDVVQPITASGTPDECRAKVREYVGSGATCPILLGADVGAMIDPFEDGRF